MEQHHDLNEEQRRPGLSEPPEATDTEQAALHHDAQGITAAYARAMEMGEQQYAHVLHLLSDMGLSAYFTQTGGMNAAIEVTLESQHYLLVTDAEDSLTWQWADHRGWAVGLYRPPAEDDAGEEPIRFQTTDDGSPDALLDLIHEVLNPQADQESE
jgi:hypothetical protein